MAVQAPEGTRDLLPDEAKFWNYFKSTAIEICGRYGYVLMETPIFEQSDLFVRGIGEATDVVSKEMFAAVSGENLKKVANGEELRDKSRLSLRPEGTAGIVRAAVQHDMVPQGAAPAKLMYAGPMFRAERPQKGRQRQFNQVGVECLGAEDPSVDAEGIIMLMRFYATIGIPVEKTRLILNSMGCDKCRPAYREALLSYMRQHDDELCEDCRRRAELNPLRAFDCKNPSCIAVMAGAPKISDFLCDQCRAHYEIVKEYLRLSGLHFVEDPTLVRGLDYYTRTVFEVQVVEGMGSQNAIGGGGRYDKLVEEVGGRPTPGFGWALGYERCVLALEAAGHAFPPAKHCDVFVACVDDTTRAEAFSLVQAMRDAGISAEMDHQHRSLKSQFKLADKLGVSITLVLGPDEMAKGQAVARSMQTHRERTVDLKKLKEVLSHFGGQPFGASALTLEDVFDNADSER